ncbi:Methylmalonyl-CoA epimerase protein [Dioscorea alata]|uniref:Methylmalonyl-CoA epimerase protein n=1 Tax=Dioscorea alata TaxID=55571 RepID=A0ACB7WFN3_DIOAL|nr:Methylmalonyl-CoA epimerase protein [Dioscorea alata]
MLDRRESSSPLPLTSLNHISMLCSSLEKSLHFYQNVLGFYSIKRPSSFDFNGAWLFSNFGFGIHLLQAEDPCSLPKKTEINPKDDHISFQCESMSLVERKLKEMGIRYMQRQVEDGGVYVDQLFFHDPDGLMIEICNCEKLPVIPLINDDPIKLCRIASIKQQQKQMVQCQIKANSCG